jgi:nucleoside diphosphate kinase
MLCYAMLKNRYNRLMTLKKYANSGTRDYMEAREVHYLCKVPRSNTTLLSPLLKTGKMLGLKIAQIVTANASSGLDELTCESGDLLLELVGLLASNHSTFIEAAMTLDTDLQAIVATAENVQGFFSSFPKHRLNTANCTLCLIRPHVLKDHLVGDVLNEISNAGFTIDQVMSFHISLNMAENIFNAYRKIYSMYEHSLAHICSGPCVAVLVTNPNAPETIVQDFRHLTGPMEPDIARRLRPKSLRSIFGKDSVHNAVHCTDLPEDGEMECRYFFETIANLSM